MKSVPQLYLEFAEAILEMGGTMEPGENSLNIEVPEQHKEKAAALLLQLEEDLKKARPN